MNTTMNTGAASLSDETILAIEKKVAYRAKSRDDLTIQTVRACIDAAIAAGGAQEPVAWMTKSDGYVFYGYNKPDRVEEELVPLYAAPLPREAATVAPPILAADHRGMRVDYSGMFKQATGALNRGIKEPALAEMLRQLKDHMTELGQRWYAGDTAVVDELLQLYCVERDARIALAAPDAASNGEQGVGS